MRLSELKQLDEMTTLSRVQGHFNDPKRSMAIMSASKDEIEEEENIARANALSADIKNSRLYGYIFVDGYYVMQKDTPNERRVKERSVIIIGRMNDGGNLKRLLGQWMNNFDQESVIFKPEGTTNIFLLYRNGKTVNLGKFHPDKIADNMTKLKGRGERTFVFECFGVGKTWMERITEQARNRNK